MRGTVTPTLPLGARRAPRGECAQARLPLAPRRAAKLATRGRKFCGMRDQFTASSAAGRLPGFVNELQSIGFPPLCHSSYKVLAITLVGFTPTEHASLRWAHKDVFSSKSGQNIETMPPVCRERNDGYYSRLRLSWCPDY